MKRYIVFGIVFLILLVGLSGCTGESDKAKAERIGEDYLFDTFPALHSSEGYEKEITSGYNATKGAWTVYIETWIYSGGIMQSACYKCYVRESDWTAYGGEYIGESILDEVDVVSDFELILGSWRTDTGDTWTFEGHGELSGNDYVEELDKEVLMVWFEMDIFDETIAFKVVPYKSYEGENYYLYNYTFQDNNEKLVLACNSGYKDGPYPYGYRDYECWNQTHILIKI